MTVVQGSSRAQTFSENTQSFETVFTCDRCKNLLIGRIPLATTHLQDPGSFYMTAEMDSWWEAHGENANKYVMWIPNAPQGKDFPDVPDHVASAANEAYLCLSSGAVMAAILMARTVIEATAKEKGVTKGTLMQKIDKLADEGKISPLMKDTAHTLRDYGNDMAHGDIKIAVDKSDAESVLRFMDLLLRDVFQIPAELERLKTSVAARKAPPVEAGEDHFTEGFRGHEV